MEINKNQIKNEKSKSKYKDSGNINIGKIFIHSNNIKSNENKRKKNKIIKNYFDKSGNKNQKIININIRKKINLTNNLCDSSEKIIKNSGFIEGIKNNNSGDIHKTITNSYRANKFKDCPNFKKLLDIKDNKNVQTTKYDIKIHKIEDKKQKRKEYRIETIFNYPIKYIDNSINFNNYFISERINYKTFEKNSPILNKNKEHLIKNMNNKIIKRKILNNKDNFNKIGQKCIKSRIKKEIEKSKSLKNDYNYTKMVKNDTEIKYINNDDEDINESNEKEIIKKYEKEKIVNKNDDIDKYIKLVDSLNNEEEYDFPLNYKNAIKTSNFNQNENKIFDDELSSICSNPDKKYKKQKEKIKIQSPIKIEIKQENQKIKNLKSKHIINNKNSELNKKPEKNEFSLLLDNKTFKKFLKNKIKYYMEEEDIPKQFINSLKISKEKKISPQIQKNKNKIIKYDTFFAKSSTEGNKNIYENLENDNIRKEKEIKKLKEKLDSQKIIIFEKKEKINELQNINQNLKQEVKALKNKYFFENYKKELTMNDINFINEKNNYNKNKMINCYIDKFHNNNNYIKAKDSKYDDLSYEELNEIKNKLIKIRKETNNEYFNIENNKENYQYRINLEKKLNKINNSLMEIRKNLQNYEK